MLFESIALVSWLKDANIIGIFRLTGGCLLAISSSLLELEIIIQYVSVPSSKGSVHRRPYVLRIGKKKILLSEKYLKINIRRTEPSLAIKSLRLLSLLVSQPKLFRNGSISF